MAARTIDGTSLYHDAISRIQQLEALNATLAAQVNRLYAVVVAVRRWEANDKAATRNALRVALANYDDAMAQLAKEG
jgi:hypothetical protein